MNSDNKEIIKAIEIIPQTRFILEEFIAILADIKPVMIHGADLKDIELIQSNFPHIKIARSNYCGQNGLYLCAISKKKALPYKH